METDRQALAAIERNLEKLGLIGAELAREDAPRRLAADVREGRRYDLVLIDPPYRMLPQVLASLSPHLATVLAPDGLVVVESDARETPELPLELRTSRRYGSRASRCSGAGRETSGFDLSVRVFLERA